MSSIDEQIDFRDLEDKYRVEQEEGFDCIVLVDGIPVIPESKKAALIRVLTKTLDRFGKLKEDGIFMPFGEDGQNKGFAFVEYETPAQANRCVRELNGYKLDKAHTFQVNLIGDVEKYAEMPDEYRPPREEQAFQEHEHLRSWLADYAGRDQYVVLRGDEVSVNWNNKEDGPEPEVARNNWTETYTQWSPLGSYLASFHQQGLQLWGGASWKRIARFAHPRVKLIDFSPQESFLVTWSNEPLELPPAGHPARLTMPFTQEDEGKQVFVWDLKKGILLRSFPGQTLEPNKKMVWPMFKWSSDEKYLARMTPGQIWVYETPSMGLLEKKSIKIEGVVDFEWSPAQPLLSYWTPEVGNQPARVSVMAIPSKEIVRTKNLYSVSDCKMHWQSAGDYLCIKVDRHTKSKKGSFTNLEIFRVCEKNIPVEVIEIKDTVINFAWEPKGARFALIQTNDPNLGTPLGVTLKTTLAFYALEAAKQKHESNFKLVRAIDRKTCNSLAWSPKGRFLVAATLGSTSTFDLEFWDVDFEGDKKEDEKEFAANLQCLSTAEHYGITDLEWDPSGRYLTTSSSFWKHKMENGFTLWDFKGQQIAEQPLENFKQIIWRPRPPSLLSKADQKQIRKNLRDYSRTFDDEDNLKQNEAARELLEERRRLVDEWNEWREGVLRRLAEDRKYLNKPQHWAERLLSKQQETEKVEELVEEVISEHSEVVSKATATAA
ncbi:Translation initiation factor 3 subunit b [Savitreella phatthalungensis]